MIPFDHKIANFTYALIIRVVKFQDLIPSCSMCKHNGTIVAIKVFRQLSEFSRKVNIYSFVTRSRETNIGQNQTNTTSI